MPITTYDRGEGLRSMGLITGDSGLGSAGYTYANNLAALAGGGQSGATLIAKAFNRFTTVATAADSCQLPLAYGGQCILITNAHASNAMQIFGNSAGTDTINGTAGATGISLAAGKTIELNSYPGLWHGILSA